ncbi:ATPase family AAA domain-containing protein FIGL1 [Medicago truncatula]|uniref:ATPase family AAA domain-containing protein FIGL1 n=1 Tax=Medicago truncatula TaxID=3880 RepID=UPI000D2F20D4|nr:ATPase family AAA domain-containing protein FIGL1 [Medicago truncatula]
MAPLSQETIARLKEYNYSPLIFETERQATLILQRLDKFRDLNNNHVGATLNNTLQQQQLREKLNTLQQQVQLRQQQQFQLGQQKRLNSIVAQKDGKKIKNEAEVIAPVVPQYINKLYGVPAFVPPINNNVSNIGNNAPINSNVSKIGNGAPINNNVSKIGNSAPINNNWSNTGNYSSQFTNIWDRATNNKCVDDLRGPDGQLPEKLRNVTPHHIEHVSNEIMIKNPNVHWDDIAGLAHAKKCVNEMAIYPLRRPDLFMGCRSPGKGLLLFGPPGTGKTMIGKAIAGEAKAAFFYISASSLSSKWYGEGEKLVRALFGVASCRQPAVIFVDEIDSLLSQRMSNGNEHEASRRIKTQFLIEMEGFDGGDDQVLVIGATNRPQDLDEAARRRLTKRLYIPLPSSEARAWIVRNLLEKDGLFKISNEEMEIICNLTEGYSGSDMKNLVKDASMGPLREAMEQGIDIMELKKEDMRPVTLQDFKNSLQEIRPSVSPNELGTFEQWNKQFGTLAV